MGAIAAGAALALIRVMLPRQISVAEDAFMRLKAVFLIAWKAH